MCEYVVSTPFWHSASVVFCLKKNDVVYGVDRFFGSRERDRKRERERKRAGESDTERDNGNDAASGTDLVHLGDS